MPRRHRNARRDVGMSVRASPADGVDASSARDRPDLPALEVIQRRLLGLAVRMVDHANRERANPDAIKVGGHQASSASLVSIMTALWFHHLDADDRTSVKPHASPVLHAINYLLGQLERDALTTLRAYRGLQAYPSRTKDPDRIDFSTGSVGLGAVAPLFAAVTRRYVDTRFGPRPTSRFVSLLGDAELDEGTVWEAVNDPISEGLGDVLWVVDFNRQSLDRVIPGVRIDHWRAQFEAAGWHVLEVKYGSRLLEAYTHAGGARRCAGGSTTCPTSATRRCSPARNRNCVHGSSRTLPTRSSPRWPRSPTTSSGDWSPTSAATTSRS
ncbi:MAG: hypothetical protein JJT89_00735 [Nitriliruptoraceae bacterium]|nr:hypothetical protein [Nitriliruptoraceae bacterium]